ncbi:14910_t:CDS:1, partial [Racocetra persica]
SFKCCGVSTEIDGSKNNLIFNFKRVLDIKGVKIDIKKEEESNDLVSEDAEESNEPILEDTEESNELVPE